VPVVPLFLTTEFTKRKDLRKLPIVACQGAFPPLPILGIWQIGRMPS